MQKHKTAHITMKPFFKAKDSSDEECPTAMMMARGARPKPVARAESGWTFPEGQVTPAGGDRKFVYGALKGKTFIDVTLEHPEQYFANCKSKTLSNEAKEYIAWVDKIFEVDKDAKQINERGILLTANATAPSTRLDAASCKHANVHHKGSSSEIYLQGLW
jgi:hypothetical protein